MIRIVKLRAEVAMKVADDRKIDSIETFPFVEDVVKLQIVRDCFKRLCTKCPASVVTRFARLKNAFRVRMANDVRMEQRMARILSEGVTCVDPPRLRIMPFVI